MLDKNIRYLCYHSRCVSSNAMLLLNLCIQAAFLNVLMSYGSYLDEACCYDRVRLYCGSIQNQLKRCRVFSFFWLCERFKTQSKGARPNYFYNNSRVIFSHIESLLIWLSSVTYLSIGQSQTRNFIQKPFSIRFLLKRMEST